MTSLNAEIRERILTPEMLTFFTKISPSSCLMDGKNVRFNLDRVASRSESLFIYREQAVDRQTFGQIFAMKFCSSIV